MTKPKTNKAIVKAAVDTERQVSDLQMARKNHNTMYRYDIYKIGGYMVLPNNFIKNFSQFKAAPLTKYGTDEFKNASSLNASAFFVIIYMLEEFSRRKTPIIAISQQLMEKQTGLSKSTIHRSLCALEDFKYIERLKKRRSVSTGFIRQFDIKNLIWLNERIAAEQYLLKQEKLKEENANVVDLENYSLIDLSQIEVTPDDANE